MSKNRIGLVKRSWTHNSEHTYNLDSVYLRWIHGSKGTGPASWRTASDPAPGSPSNEDLGNDLNVKTESRQVSLSLTTCRERLAKVLGEA